MDQHELDVSMSDEFDAVYSSDPNKYDYIANITLSDAMEIGIFNKEF